jgi:hypothetical protein
VSDMARRRAQDIVCEEADGLIQVPGTAVRSDGDSTTAGVVGYRPDE